MQGTPDDPVQFGELEKSKGSSDGRITPAQQNMKDFYAYFNRIFINLQAINLKKIDTKVYIGNTIIKPIIAQVMGADQSRKA